MSAAPTPIPVPASPPTPPNPPIPRVKICGVTEADQAHAIAELGADYLGINFWPHSKRYLPWEKASTWLADLPKTIKPVGVFVNPDVDLLMEIADSGLLHAFQLHGDESAPFCHELQRRGLTIIKAFQVRNPSTLELVSNYHLHDVLLDAYHPSERGGLGHTFPWELAQDFRRRQPDSALWLAGGLTHENVAEAVRGVHPAVVDVASGVEDDQPGIKNLQKVTLFLQSARNP